MNIERVRELIDKCLLLERQRDDAREQQEASRRDEDIADKEWHATSRLLAEELNGAAVVYKDRVVVVRENAYRLVAFPLPVPTDITEVKQ